MQRELTAVFRKVPGGYVAFVEELPGANAQGVTLREARENLREAVALVLEADRLLAEEELVEADDRDVPPAASGSELERLAVEALEEDRAARTEELGFDEL